MDMLDCILFYLAMLAVHSRKLQQRIDKVSNDSITSIKTVSVCNT